MTNTTRKTLAGFLVALALSAGPAMAQAADPNAPKPDAQSPGPRAGDPPKAAATDSTRASATGMVTNEQRPRLRELALKHREIELKMSTDITVGTVLPADAKLLDIPPEFGLERFRLALANQRTLLVDPTSRRVEEVIQ